MIDKVKSLWEKETFAALRKHAKWPFLLSCMIAGLMMALIILISFCRGELDNMIASYDLRYNSGAIWVLGISFTVVLVIFLGIGIFFSAWKYKRKIRKRNTKKADSNINSYKALNHVLTKRGAKK